MTCPIGVIWRSLPHFDLTIWRSQSWWWRRAPRDDRNRGLLGLSLNPTGMICAVADGAAVAAGGVDDDCDDDRSDDAAADRNHDHRIVDRDSLAYDVELAVAVVVAFIKPLKSC